MPVGSSLRISSSVVVHGRTEEKTCCSRMRRAMSCVYWPPKSRTTTPPSSELGRWCCCCIWTPLDICPPLCIHKGEKTTLIIFAEFLAQSLAQLRKRRQDRRTPRKSPTFRLKPSPHKLRNDQIHELVWHYNLFHYALAVYVLCYGWYGKGLRD